jgi:hypothetical protein
VRAFDRLYRAQLAALYRALGEAPPVDLDRPLGHGRADAGAHVMLPTD